MGLLGELGGGLAYVASEVSASAISAVSHPKRGSSSCQHHSCTELLLVCCFASVAHVLTYYKLSIPETPNASKPRPLKEQRTISKSWAIHYAILTHRALDIEISLQNNFYANSEVHRF